VNVESGFLSHNPILMPSQNSERTEFVYYPDGDRDPNSRLTMMSLVREGEEWRVMGRSKPLSPDEFQGIAENVEKGRGEIQKIMGSSRRRMDGKADLLRAVQRDQYRKAA
jgi:hypothetical protein